MVGFSYLMFVLCLLCLVIFIKAVECLLSFCTSVSVAHEDAIWTAAWGKSEKDGSETIITGSLDDTVKVWKW